MGRLALQAYEGIGLDDLVVYCASRILQGGEECTFPRLVAECFLCFPAKFSLPGYPEWPDAVRVNKCWLRCRTDRGWLTGSVQAGFRLTAEGEAIARRVSEQLQVRAPVTKRRPAARPRDRSVAGLEFIRSSEPFKAYERNQGRIEIDEMELRSLLGARMETPVRVLKENWRYFVNVATRSGDKAVRQFLEACRASSAWPRVRRGGAK